MAQFQKRYRIGFARDLCAQGTSNRWLKRRGRLVDYLKPQYVLNCTSNRTPNQRIKRQSNLVQHLTGPPTSMHPTINAIEQATNRKLAVALGTLSLRLIGGLGFPLLRA